MRTMNTIKVITWVEGRGQVKLANIIKDLYSVDPMVDAEKLEAIFYFTLGSRLGPKLFREMKCEVTTFLYLEEA